MLSSPRTITHATAASTVPFISADKGGVEPDAVAELASFITSECEHLKCATCRRFEMAACFVPLLDILPVLHVVAFVPISL